MRVLCADHGERRPLGPLAPFARACKAAGHEVRVAAPVSYAGTLERAGFAHEAFADAPRELIGPVMDRLPSLPFEEADEIVIREVFARIDAQAALPGVSEAIARWRPDVVLRESAELASLVASERAGVPHVHVCIGMHEVLTRFADCTTEPLDDLGRLAGLPAGRAGKGLDDELVLSLVPALLDEAAGSPTRGQEVLRFRDPVAAATTADPPAVLGARDLPLVYVTFGSVTGSLPSFAGVFRDALEGLAGLDARVLMTVGRRLDPDDLRPWPANAHVEQWLPQDAVLRHAAAMLGHGGFGTTMGALAAGVPQVVAPLFSFDQAVNGEHVAAVGAGHTAGMGPGAVAKAVTEVPRVLEDPSYAAGSRAVAEALAGLPHPRDAVPVLESLVG